MENLLAQDSANALGHARIVVSLEHDVNGSHQAGLLDGEPKREALLPDLRLTAGEALCPGLQALVDLGVCDGARFRPQESGVNREAPLHLPCAVFPFCY